MPWSEVLIVDQRREFVMLAMQEGANRRELWPSTRATPEHLPQVEYDEREIVCSVPTTKDYISFKGRALPRIRRQLSRSHCRQPYQL